MCTCQRQTYSTSLRLPWQENAGRFACEAEVPAAAQTYHAKALSVRCLYVSISMLDPGASPCWTWTSRRGAIRTRSSAANSAGPALASLPQRVGSIVHALRRLHQRAARLPCGHAYITCEPAAKLPLWAGTCARMQIEHNNSDQGGCPVDCRSDNIHRTLRPALPAAFGTCLRTNCS